MADNDVSKMKVADLKRELKVRGLRTTGNKDELVERLQSALIEGDAFDDPEDLLDDDVLNDEELEEEDILNSPHGSTSPKSVEAQPSATTPSQQKKVVLKRKLAPTLSSSEDPSEISTSISDIPKTAKLSDEQVRSNGARANNGSDGESSIVKLSQLTMKERLELRAKKFGATPSVEALKQARAERFGLGSNLNISNTQTPAETTATQMTASSNVDALKKRAERFGGSVSNVMATIENKEKLLKRQERFKISSTANTAAPATFGTSNEYAEKAKLRAERFKTST